MKDFSILLCTCNKYNFLVNPFLTLFYKYWPSYKGFIYINTEDVKIPDINYENVFQLNNSKSLNWSDRMIASLNAIKEDYVLLILDDFLFKGPVDENEFSNIFDFQKNKKVKCVQFYPQNHKNKEIGLKNFYLRKRFAPYRISAQICMYERKYLLKILRRNENPWEYEVCGSFRSSLLYGGKILCAKRTGKYIFDTDIGFLLVRGHYTEEIRKRFEKDENIYLPDLPTPLLSNKKKSRLINKFKLGLKCLTSIFKRR